MSREGLIQTTVSAVPMSPDELHVWAMVARHKSPAECVSQRVLREYWGLDARTVRDVVRSLRRTHRQPIGSTAKGYFLAVRDEDLEEAGRKFVRQAIDMIQTARVFWPRDRLLEALGQLRLTVEDGGAP